MAIMFSSYRYAMDDPCNEEVQSRSAKPRLNLVQNSFSEHHLGARSALERTSRSASIALPWLHYEFAVFDRMAQILHAPLVHANLSAHAG
jgi:hypothetical protein